LDRSTLRTVCPGFAAARHQQREFADAVIVDENFGDGSDGPPAAGKMPI
jgi:hypothetical protein